MNQAKSNVLPFKGEDALGPGLNADDIPIETDYTQKEGNGGGGDGMDKILRRIENLESNVTELRVGVAKIEASIPVLAKQEDLIKLKTELETLKPHLVTKTWIANAFIKGFIGLVFAQIFIPIIQDYIHNHNSSPVQTSTQSKQHNK
jgi:hypothetical protein